MIGITKVTDGMIITINNYCKYQNPENYEGHSEGQAKGRRRASEGAQLNKEKEGNTVKKENPMPPEFIPSPFDTLLERYTNGQRETIIECLEAIASTRKFGRISENIKIGILKKWETATIDEVMDGIATYMDRRYYMDGKKENYLWGIIKNNEFKGNGRPKPKPECAPPPKLFDGKEDLYK